MELVLRRLTEADEALFLEGAKLWDGHPRDWYTFAWKPGVPFGQMLAEIENDSKGVGLPPNRVPATMLYAFIGDVIVGRLHIRHRLNEALTRRGGHIGYAVAPAFRGRKIATNIMAQGLEFCRKNLGLDKILVTCADTNVPSWKIIENFGGVLENKFFDDEDQATIRRYSINL